jgi:hypothetical protein
MSPDDDPSDEAMVAQVTIGGAFTATVEPLHQRRRLERGGITFSA